MHPDESAETAARRELAEETGLSDLSGLHLEQLRTYSEPDRDPRMRVVSVAFAALLPDPPEPHGGSDAAEARWVPYDKAGPLAFDHDRILADAHERVGARLEYTCLATAFCPSEFTLGELQQVYETVWGTTLDRPNFRRKVLATPGFVEAVPGAARLTGGRGKPAALYRAGPAATLHPLSSDRPRKDAPHDHDPDQTRRHRHPRRPRPRGRPGLPDRVQRRAVDPRQVRAVAGDGAVHMRPSSATTPR